MLSVSHELDLARFGGLKGAGHQDDRRGEREVRVVQERCLHGDAQRNQAKGQAKRSEAEVGLSAGAPCQVS